MTAADDLTVTSQHFNEQLDVLSQFCRVISLRELVSNLRERRVLKRAVVLTFDDGYADVLHQARPLLERYQSPATVFITTGSLGREFWWDMLGRVLLASARLPEGLFLQIKDNGYEWVPGQPQKRSSLDSMPSLLQSTYRQLLLLSPPEREKAMLQFWAWSGTKPDDRPYRRAMTVNELLELATDDLIDIGAHTVTHPVLAGLPIPAQRSEIQESKAYLEKILGRPVTSFAYPNGSFSLQTLDIVRQSGFQCACASDNDVVWRGSNCFSLPRFWIPDWDGEVFSRWLRLWLPA